MAEIGGEGGGGERGGAGEGGVGVRCVVFGCTYFVLRPNHIPQEAGSDGCGRREGEGYVVWWFNLRLHSFVNVYSKKTQTKY